MRCHVAAFAVLLGSAATAQEEASQTRQVGAHVHGVATLTAAAQDGALAVELVTPAFNLVGFERAPATPEEEGAVTVALAFVENAEAALTLDPRAECTADGVTMTPGDLAGAAAEASSHDGHDHDHDHDDDHDDHDHHEGHDHDHDHDHDDHEHEAHGGADVTARYQFACAKPDRLAWIEVNFFEAFERLERVDAAYLDATRQTAAVLTPEAVRFDLRP